MGIAAEQLTEVLEHHRREREVASELKGVLKATGRRVDDALESHCLRVMVNGRWYKLEVIEY